MGMITLDKTKGVLDRGQVLLEIEFLSKHCVSEISCCVLVSCGPERLTVLKRLFPLVRFYPYGIEEEYDPEHGFVEYRGNMQLDEGFMMKLHTWYDRVLLINTCHPYSLTILSDLHMHVNPYKSLFLVSASAFVPQEYFLSGTLFPGVHYASCLSDFIHMECDACPPRWTLYNGIVMTEELAAFQLLTRGLLDDTYDKQVEQDILAEYCIQFKQQMDQVKGMIQYI